MSRRSDGVADPHPPELVIFDCDGVLVDSEPISNGVLAEMLSEQGLTMTLAQTRLEYQGMTLAQVREHAQERLGRELPPGWLDEYQRRRAERFRASLRPVPGAAEAVRTVAAAGVKVCVASQGSLEKSSLTLGLTGLDALFAADAVFSAAQVPRPKPYPDLFLHAAAAMRVGPERCAVVEDTRSGIAAARSGGMLAIGLTRDSDERALAEAGAMCVASMSAVPAVLGLNAGG
jgi:HAD superfamily hydrolase (TIGR01509 family)